MKKVVKVEWCRNFIIALFTKRPEMRGIETNCFFEYAERAGLYKKGTYGTPISDALGELTEVETVSHNGKYSYSIFVLKNTVNI